MKKKKPANYIELTPYQRQYLIDNYHSKTIAVMSSHLGLKPTIMRTRAYELGLKKFEMEYWTEVQMEFLEFIYGLLGDTEIAEYFQKHFPKGKAWTKKHIEKKRRYLRLKRTPDEKRHINSRNTMLGCFEICNKKMWETRGITPVGAVKVWRYKNKRSFPVIRTEKGFVHYAPVLWEQHYGPVPEGMCVHINDNAPDIPAIEHLSLMTRKEMMQINAQSDATISKRFLGAKNNDDVQFLVENCPELIEVKRNQIKLNGKLNEYKKQTRKLKR